MGLRQNRCEKLPKTERHEGKASRVMPLFPGIATVLGSGEEC